MVNTIIAAAALAVWLYLILARGAFWLATPRDDGEVPPSSSPPSSPPPRVVAVIPARDEAMTIGETVASLLRQDYAGSFSVILVDDNSGDATAAVARKAAADAGAPERLTTVAGQPLPAGWTGKLWAMKQGIDAAAGLQDPPDYLLLTDADIVYAPATLTKLLARAESGRLVLTSLMVKLRCDSLAERTLVPAFIFFFQMLYPFSWVNKPNHALAAAAGGCMLVRPEALRDAGGVEAIRGALIDDCALARKLKRHGPIWLGLTNGARSIRSYPRFEDMRRMVSRSAYAQLRYSPILLLGTVIGMALTYLAGPLIALFGHGIPQILGAIVWGLMTVAFQPILRFYRLAPSWGPALPVIALVYMAFTLDSAYQHVRGRGGVWKGRAQANVSELG